MIRIGPNHDHDDYNHHYDGHHHPHDDHHHVDRHHDAHDDHLPDGAVRAGAHPDPGAAKPVSVAPRTG